MEQYIVSARKYRPSTFKSVVGQHSLTTTLKNAIDSKRLAQAYLFCGPRGVGKTSCARIFAKTINCLSPTPDGEACNECESCRAFNEGRSYNIVELDAASNNSVDDIRNLTDQVRIPPQIGNYRVFIIDEVHMLSVQAFNAFLKTLEEPPKYVVFILATTEKHKVIPTILSRCQIYDFNRITINDMVEHLSYVASQEGISAEPAALNVIARKADGAMRDALSIFDQVAASSMNNITYRSAIDNLNVLDYDYHFRLVNAFLAGDVKESLLIYKEIRDNGFDSLFFINGLANHIRDLMVAADPKTLPLLEVSEDLAQQYINQASAIRPKWFYNAMEICNSCDLNYRTSSNKQFLVELTLIRLCQSADSEVATTGGNQPATTLQKVTPSATSTSATSTTSATPTPTKATATPQPTATTQDATLQSKQESKIHTLQVPPKTEHQKIIKHPVSMRINAVRNSSVSEDSAKTQQSHQNRLEPFTYEQLLSAWDNFIDRHPDLHILKNSMVNSKPKLIAENRYKVIVENPVQKQMFDTSMPVLLSFLRDGVNNDSLTLEVEIDTTFERPRYLTQAELLRKIVNSNESMAKLIENFDMELA